MAPRTDTLRPFQPNAAALTAGAIVVAAMMGLGFLAGRATRAEGRGAAGGGHAATGAHPAGAETVADVLGTLRGDGAGSVREAAAHALGGAPPEARARVQAEIERAFGGEADPGARRAMLASLVRLGGPQALAQIERLRGSAGVAEADCDDYIEILRSGETQADRIFEQKLARELARGGPPGQ